jgi:hypothetical protein
MAKRLAIVFIVALGLVRCGGENPSAPERMDGAGVKTAAHTLSASPTPTPIPWPTWEEGGATGEFTYHPNPPHGLAPLEAHFNMCHATNPNPGINLHYHVVWGDGSDDRGFCRFVHTYSGAGEFQATACVWDEIPAHAPGKCLTVTFTVSGSRSAPPSSLACGTNDVSSGGHCYYLDGSGGACDPGYALASQVVLSSIAPAFVGLNYKHTVSGNCCIQNSQPVENWGMANHCNAPGPFTLGDPSLGAIGCTNATNFGPTQLTLCGK